MRKTIIVLFALLWTSAALGQSKDKEVAVMQPYVMGGATVKETDKLLMVGAMEEAFTKIDGYKAYTRTNQKLIEAEQAFQRSGKVADDQIKAVGAQVGVAYICVFTLAIDGNELVIKASVIDVETAHITNSKTVVCLNRTNRDDVIQKCELLPYSLLGVKAIQDIKGSTTINDYNKQNTATEYYAKGNNARDNKNYEQAIEYYKQAINIDPNYSRAYRSLGSTYGRIKNYDQAITVLNKAISIDAKHKSKGEDELIYEALGLVYERMENYDKAIFYYNKCLSENPNNADAYLGLGDANQYLGNYQQAIVYYNKAMTLEPGEAMIYSGLGDTYLEMKNYTQAIYYYNKSISINPNDEWAYNSIADAYEELGKNKEAVENHKKAAKLGNKYSQEYLRKKGISW